MGTRRQQEWVQGDNRSGYRESIGVGTGRLQEWVQGDYRSRYKRLQEWVQGDNRIKQYRIKNIWSPPGIEPKYF